MEGCDVREGTLLARHRKAARLARSLRAVSNTFDRRRSWQAGGGA